MLTLLVVVGGGGGGGVGVVVHADALSVSVLCFWGTAILREFVIEKKNEKKERKKRLSSSALSFKSLKT